MVGFIEALKRGRGGGAAPSTIQPFNDSTLPLPTFPLCISVKRIKVVRMWKTRLAILAVAAAILAGLALLFFVVLPLLKSPPPPKVANTPNLIVQVQGQPGENGRRDREDGETCLPHAYDFNPFD